MPDRKKTLLYFGCLRESGHYLFADESGRSLCKKKDVEAIVGFLPDGILWEIDGKFTPKSTSEQGSYREVIVGQFRIISWHDYTVDRRHGSNSSLLGVGYESSDDMFADAAVRFPSVMRRQTRTLSRMP